MLLSHGESGPPCGTPSSVRPEYTSELSSGNSFRRSVCIDELTFDANGRINTVTPTKNGPAPAAAGKGFK
jgi:hypothetical protein